MVNSCNLFLCDLYFQVQHVINYDFPLFVSDYIHRAGRVGRVGAKHNGQVTSLVSHSWEVDVLWQIEVSVVTYFIISL